MKAMTPSTDERFAALYEEMRRPAKAMVRNAFRTAFDDADLDDIYSNAWVGVIRALERRAEEMDDEELRKYLFAAVANHASKELRRRGRKPIAPLEAVEHRASASTPEPEQLIEGAEQSQVTKDVLASLPPRRRAVMVLRYSWGLSPAEVCDLVPGLSPRAYRKEVGKGVEEVAAKLELIEQGGWCDDRKPVIRNFAAGLADSDEALQAKHHLAHCRSCSDFVAQLSSQLHDLGSGAAWVGLAGVIGEQQGGLAARAGESLDRVAGIFSRGSDTAQEASMALASSGGSRGAGAAGLGVATKVAGFGAAGKAALACAGTTAAAVSCMAAGVVPSVELIGASGPPGDERDEVVKEEIDVEPIAGSGGDELPVVSTPAPQEAAPQESKPVEEPVEVPAPERAEPAVSEAAPEAPPVQQEFGLPGAASGGGSSYSEPAPSPSRGPGSGGGGQAGAAESEFGL